jgi:hypothetical protein
MNNKQNPYIQLMEVKEALSQLISTSSNTDRMVLINVKAYNSSTPLALTHNKPFTSSRRKEQ